MKEVWKEFFRLKWEEINHWWEWTFMEAIFPIIAVLFIFIYGGMSVGATLCFFLNEKLSIFWKIMSYQPLLWIVIWTIWFTKCFIWWISSNWEQAKKNVEQRDYNGS